MTSRVKIAVLDTGIDKNHEYLKDNIIGGLGFYNTKDYILVSEEYEDENGHGTCCASIIKNEFENVEIFVMKVLDKNGMCSMQVLEEALKYIISTDIRLINLSLSIIDTQSVNKLYDICNELSKREKILVCSLANGFDESFPAIFDNVIGVRGFILESENAFWYNKDEKIQCIIDNNPYLACNLDNSYKLFGKCNSQAAAKLTGKIAKILSKDIDISLQHLHENLEYLAISNTWTNQDFCSSKRFADHKFGLYEIDNERLKAIVKIVKNTLDIDNSDEQLYELSLFSSKIGLTYERCFDIIKALEYEFNMKFHYRCISRYDFASIYTLLELVEKNLELKGD